MFDPKAHLIQLPRRVKDPTTGHFTTRHEEYLEVKWRLVWFREKFPHGHLGTEFLRLDWEQGIAICKCIVNNGEGGCAHGTGTETRKGFEDFVEKSETRAIGRALAALGIGTQFVGEEMSEGEHIVDAPVTSTATAAPDAAHETTGISHPLPVGEEGTPGAPTPPATNGHSTAPKATARMTPEAIEALFHLALEQCQEDKEAFGTRVKRAMKIGEEVKINKKFLCESMTPDMYRTVYTWYETLYAQLQRPTEVSDADDSTAAAPPKSTAAPAVDGSAAVPLPAASSSAPEPSPDAAERDRVRLRKEVARWDLRVPPEEVEHVIQHNSSSKARALLWKCRRQDTAAD